MKIKINELVIKKRMRSVKPEKVEAIAGSIKEVGLITPICVNSDLELVAGLHRVEAAKLLGWKEIECNVVDFNSELRQLLAEIDENLQRSDLSVLERSDWLKERKRIYEELYPETKQKTGSELVERRWNTNAESAFVKESFTTTTAKVTGQSKRTIETEIQIANNINEDVKEILKDTEFANQKTSLLDLSKLDAPQQLAVAKKAVEKSLPSLKDAITEVKKEEKKEARKQLIEQQIEDIETGKLPELKGLYDVISVDPPWPYGREYDPAGSRVANPYPEMSIDEIKAIELPFKDDAVLFLWTTHQFLPSAFEILKHWGFEYKATLVWNKEKIGMGAWLRMQCEFCLVGIKGNPYWENTTERDIINEARREHSRKPDAFFSMVEKITLGRRLEYFSREQRNGWDVFGNDTEKFELAG